MVLAGLLAAATHPAAEIVVGHIPAEGVRHRFAEVFVDLLRGLKRRFGEVNQCDRFGAPQRELERDGLTDTAGSACNECYFIFNFHCILHC